jgi:poly(3-hydroxybutyrate) depolymerase
LNRRFNAVVGVGLMVGAGIYGYSYAPTELTEFITGRPANQPEVSTSQGTPITTPEISATTGKAKVETASQLGCVAFSGNETTVSGRRILVSAPAGEKLPLIVALHGTGGESSPENFEAQSGLTEYFKGKAVIVYPEGSERNGSLGWDTFTREGNEADKQSITDAIALMAAKHCTEKTAVLVAQSGGTALLATFLCDPKHNVGLKAAIFVNPAIGPAPLEACQISKEGDSTLQPVPLELVAGALDTTAPIDGGGTYTLVSQRKVLNIIGGFLNNCSAQPPVVTKINNETGTYHEALRDCMVPTGLTVVGNGGHRYPTVSGDGSGEPPLGGFDTNGLIQKLLSS